MAEVTEYQGLKRIAEAANASVATISRSLKSGALKGHQITMGRGGPLDVAWIVTRQQITEWQQAEEAKKHPIPEPEPEPAPNGKGPYQVMGHREGVYLFGAQDVDRMVNGIWQLIDSLRSSVDEMERLEKAVNGLTSLIDEVARLEKAVAALASKK